MASTTEPINLRLAQAGECDVCGCSMPAGWWVIPLGDEKAACSQACALKYREDCPSDQIKQARELREQARELERQARQLERDSRSSDEPTVSVWPDSPRFEPLRKRDR